MTFSDKQFNIRHFIGVANDNTTEALEKLGPALEYLERIDLVFREFIEGGGAIRPALAAVLLLNAHASFRAAIRFAFSGQLPPVFMALRGAIESALYANGMVVDEKLQAIWLDRHRDEESRNRCKNAFNIKDLLKSLATVQSREFADGVKDAYSATIDFGAHPNSRSLLSHLRLSEVEGGKQAMELAYLHGFMSTELRQCLIACAEIGILVVFVALICAPKGERVAALNEKMLAVQKDLPDLLKSLGLALGPQGNT